MELVPNGLFSKQPHIQGSSHICLSHYDASEMTPRLTLTPVTLDSLLLSFSKQSVPQTPDEKTELEAPSRPGITCTPDFSNFLSLQTLQLQFQ